ncbi:MAG: ABC transporter permease [Actinomycetes bacterium]|jgi:peptide/nickel transport system permease protein/oligopeptide transport system permease protein|nr:ABC transporter permease [Actinomycetes bacterium]
MPETRIPSPADPQLELDPAESALLDASGADAAADADAAAQPRKSRTLYADAWYRLRKNRLAIAAIIWIVLIVALAVSADWWIPRTFGDPRSIDSTQALGTRYLGPSAQHWFGTDDMGRDVFGRVAYGARVSLTVGVVATVIETILGVIIGSIAGFFGGVVDAVIMRITDIFLAFPYLLFAIIVMAVLPQEYRGVGTVVAVIALLGWASTARLVRGSVLSVKENDYVQAGRALGASNLRLMFRHILPNAIAPALVVATMNIGGAILSESAMSYLGLGIQLPQISWGGMIDSAQRFMMNHPALTIYPGVAILLTVLAFTLLGDGVRDALDVKMED